MFLKKTSPAIYNALGIYLPLITTNCAVLGVALTNVQDGYNFIQSVTAGFGTAVGYTISIVLLAGIRERIDEASVPASVPRCTCRPSVRCPDVDRIHGLCRTVTVSEWFAAEGEPISVLTNGNPGSEVLMSSIIVATLAVAVLGTADRHSAGHSR